MARIWVTGATGMLGQDLMPVLGAHHDVHGTSRHDCEIADREAVGRVFASFQPEIVVNCAAYTRVDDAEAFQEQSLEANVTGPSCLASLSRERDAFLVHISTDYVFDGKGSTPYKEDHPVKPLGTYGRHKLLGELAIRNAGIPHLIVRTSGLYGLRGRCFPATMVRLLQKGVHPKVVSDQITSPTYTQDLAQALSRLLEVNATGTVHCSNSGSCSWFEFARKTAEVFGFSPTVIAPITAAEYGAPAPRPGYSVFDMSCFETLTGLTMRPWQAALQGYKEEWFRAAPPGSP